MIAIEKWAAGRYGVTSSGKIYGVYRTVAMALYRKRQLEVSMAPARSSR